MKNFLVLFTFLFTFESVACELKAELIELAESVDIQILAEEKADYVKSLNSVIFESDSSEIKDISAVRNILKFVSKEQCSYVLIEGHTDATGTEKYNAELSAKRATSVKGVIETFIHPSLIKTVGYGEIAPIASNKTRLGRTRNRRVNVKVYVMEKERAARIRKKIMDKKVVQPEIEKPVEKIVKKEEIIKVEEKHTGISVKLLRPSVGLGFFKDGRTLRTHVSLRVSLFAVKNIDRSTTLHIAMLGLGVDTRFDPVPAISPLAIEFKNQFMLSGDIIRNTEEKRKVSFGLSLGRTF